jgi:hypothetical protein
MNSHVKDALENLLHCRVCGEYAMSLEAAQRMFLGDWIAAWRARGEPPPARGAA